MEVNVKKSENTQHELEIVIPQEEAKKYFDQAAEALSKNQEIEGFRAGKAPFDLVAKKVGHQQAYQETASRAVQDTMEQALQEQELSPLGQPEIEITQISPESEIKYTAKIATAPNFELPKLDQLEASKEEVNIEQEEIDNALETLRKRQASHLDITRPAQEGDVVEIDLELRSGGAVVEGGSQSNVPLKLGEESLLPGFDENLAGSSAGETKNFTVDLPEDFPNQSLAGKPLDAHVTVNSVKKEVLPELNDELAKKMGNFQSLDELKDSIKEGLVHEKEERAQNKLRAEILKQLREKVELELPETLINQEMENLKKQYQQEVQQMGMEWEDYLQKSGTSEEELQKTWRDQAEKNIANALILRKIANEQNITVSESEIQDEINRNLQSYPDPEKAKEEIDLDSWYAQIEARLRNEKALQYLEEQING